MNGLDQRPRAFYSIRTSLGWSAADVAAKLDVSTRMVGMWETGTQAIPDGRWRLFVHEVNAELGRSQSMVVVLDDDGFTPIDAVSDTNFYDIEVNDFDGTAVISSYVIDRRTQRPRLHTQRFRKEGNDHVLRAAAAWKAGQRIGASTGETEMLLMHRWLTRRILEAEDENPNLRELKTAIAVASNAVDLAPNEVIKRERLQELDRAVFALIHEVERSKGSSAG